MTTVAPVELSATVSITTPAHAEFTVSAYDYDTLVEIGPRTTYRRTPAAEVLPEDVLMDIWGNPSGLVAKVSTKGTRTAIRLTGDSHGTTYAASDLVNVYVESVSL